jgi:hypothetical protein
VHHDDPIIAALLCKLSNAEFHREFETVSGIEHASTMKVLHFINDLDRRKSYLELGYSSVFDYCVRKLNYSRSGAGRRIQAARCARRYPEIFAMLRTRELGIGTAAIIEPILTDYNKDEILGRVRGASHREIERVISEYRPPMALRDRLRYVQVPMPAAKDADAEFFSRRCVRSVPEEWRPATVQRVYVQFLADEEFIKVLEEVQDLMSTGDEETFAEIMKRALIECRDGHSPAARNARRQAKRGAASLESQRWECNPPQSRHVPNEVRDKIFVKDHGQCSFVAPDGTRCRCKKGLQVDHIKPYAAGGTHEPDNLRLLCGAHNRLAAEQTLGRRVMQPYWRRQ